MSARLPLVVQNMHRYFLYLALLFLIVLASDVYKALWFKDAATGTVHFGVGVGTLVLLLNVILLGGYTPRLPFAPASGGRLSRPVDAGTGAAPRLRLRGLPQSAAQVLGLVQPVLGGVHRPLHPALLDGRLERLEDPLSTTEFQTHEHDVLVIGAGGAGLRAAIEASAAGVSVGLVCKSLLGKAHTVMAEGGIAAALANVDDRDNWKVHFADTMRGGQYVNNWRMAQLHAQEAPDRVRELEAWGAVFDRTKDGRILQRNFGGHSYPAPGPRRRPHRPGNDPHPAGPRHPQGIESTWNAPSSACSRTATAIAGAFGYYRERGRFVVFKAKAVVLATGGIGKAYKITSNSWEYTGDGHTLAYDAGAELIDMEFVQFHPTGMVWPPSVRGILVTEGVRGEGGVLRNNKGERFMFGDIPEQLQATRPPRDAEEGLRYVPGRDQERDSPAAGTADARPRRPLHRPRGAGRAGQPARRRFLARHSPVDQGRRSPTPPSTRRRSCPACTTSSRSWADIDITKEPMEVGPTTHYIMGGVRVDADSQMSRVPGLFACGECAAGINGANRLGGNSLSDLLVFGKRAGEYAAKFAKDNPRRGDRPDEPGGGGRAGRWTPFDSAGRHRGSVSRCSRTCRR